MARVKRGVVAGRRHKKILKKAKGYFNARRKVFRTAKQAVSSGMSFATTYALGHVAKRYYAGGRTLSTQLLKDAYADVVEEAQGLQTRYLPEIRQKASTLDTASVLSMVRKA